MALIKSFRDVPAGGWRYVQPETGAFFKSDTYEGLIQEIIPHRKYKNIPINTLSEEVQEQLCLSLSLIECQPLPDEDYRPILDLTSKLTTGMAISLGKAIAGALASVAAGNTPLVSPAEAERRAAICRGCPFNKPASLCSCSSVYKAIEAAIPKDRKLNGVSVCMACGCTLQAKCNLPIEVVQKSLPDDLNLPNWCWQRSPASPL